MASLTIGTSASRRICADVPPEDVVPQPMTRASVPGAHSSCSPSSTTRAGSKSTGALRVSIATSFWWVAAL